jgi:hypothetical protein
VLLVGSLAACHSSRTRAEEPPPWPKVDVVLTDAGLTFSRSRAPAGYYDISFRDRRSHRPAGRPVELQFGPDAPGIALVEVPAGTRTSALLIGNVTARVMIGGVRHGDGVPGFYVMSTKDYPTPAT